jgi:hypothetical protein
MKINRKILYVKYSFAISISLFCCSVSQSQTDTTVIFKPNATIGQDATIFTLGNCKPLYTNFSNNPYYIYNYVETPANINFGSALILTLGSGTWSANGCGTGTVRALLKFTELNAIPIDAVVTDAKLKLHGVTMTNEECNVLYNDSNYMITYTKFNSYYSGSSSSPNPAWIYKVAGTWDESTVTFNNQPNIFDYKIAIPPSETQNNWNYMNDSDSLLAMVQEWIANPSSNNGIMLKIQTETPYHNMAFASSDNADSTLHPELHVTYLVNNSPCEPPLVELGANFSVCQGDTITLYNLAGTPNCTYLWSNGSTDTSISLAVNSDTSLTLQITDTITGCDKMASITVQIQQPPQITFNGDTIVCLGGSTSITATASEENCSFLWSNGSTDATISVSPTGDTTIWVTATTPDKHCSRQDSITITIQSPQVNAGNDKNICEGESYTILATGTANSYQWTSIPEDQSITIISPNYNKRITTTDNQIHRQR